MENQQPGDAPQQPADQAEQQEQHAQEAAAPPEQPAGAAAGAAAAAAAAQQVGNQAQEQEPVQQLVAAAPAAQQDHQQQVQQPASAGPAAGAPAAAAAAAEAAAAAGEPAAKRQRTNADSALPPTDFSYQPEAECDLVIKTADGKRLGVHRLIVLRACAFFQDLLEACEGEQEVTVTEPAADIRPHLLDLLYSRAAPITPANVLSVFNLADKYQAPTLMEACRPVLMSEGFKLSIPRSRTAPAPAAPVLFGFGAILPGAPAAAAAAAGGGAASGGGGSSGSSSGGQCDWLEVIALASKHDYRDLFDKCIAFLEEQCEKKPSVALADFLGNGQTQLAELRQGDLLQLMVSFAKVARDVDAKATQNRQATRTTLEQAKEAVAGARDMLERSEKKLELERSKYSKLLGRHNRLISRCEKNKVTWHKDLDPPAKQGGKKQGQGGQQQQQAAAAGGGAAAAAAGVAGAANEEFFLVL